MHTPRGFVGALLLCALHTNVAADESPTLLSCLEHIADAAHVRIIDSSNRAGALSCGPERQTRSLDASLDALLKQTGLTWRTLPDGTIEIVAAVDDTLALRPLDIEGDPVDVPRVPQMQSPTPLIDRVLTTTTLDQRWLDTAPLMGFNQIGQYAPNVYGTGQSLAIRGIERDVDYLTALIVRFDGIDLGTRLLDDELVPMHDVTELTIARGPRSFETGGGTEAGAIYLSTAAPSADPTTRLMAGVGTRGEWHSAASWSGPLGTPDLGATIAVERHELPQFINEILVPQASAGKRDGESERLKIVFTPESMPGLTAQLAMLQLSGDSSDRWIQTRVSDGAPVSQFDPYARDSYDASPTVAQTHARGEAAFVRKETTNGLVVDIHGSNTAIERDSNQLPVTANPAIADHEDRRRIGIDLRYPFGDWTVATGAEQSNDDLRSDYVYPRSYTFTAIDSRNQIDTRSAFVWIEHHWSSEWSAGLGVRNVRDDVFQSEAAFDGLVVSASRYTKSIGIPLALVEWSPMPDQTFSLTSGGGYRDGGIALYPPQLVVYKPENEQETEFTWRARWSAATKTTLTVFNNDIRDRYTFNPSLPAGSTDSDGRATLRGAEFEVESQIASLWLLRAGIGVLDTTYRTFAHGDVDLSGKPTPAAPSRTAVLGVRYGAQTGWYGAADAYHAEAAESGPYEFPQLHRPPYSLLNLRAGFRTGPWDASLIVSNALDAHYVDRAELFPTLSEASLVRYRLGDPRRTEFRMTWTW